MAKTQTHCNRIDRQRHDLACCGIEFHDAVCLRKRSGVLKVIETPYSLFLDGVAMAQKLPKTAVVAFKVEKELAELLNKLPNKSAFIRNAIAAQMGMACPLCNGRGVVPRGVHDHYLRLLEQVHSGHCDGCGDEMEVPRESSELAAEDRERLEQFFHGGPLYCDGCYDKAPTCDDCGWHIVPERVAEHQRLAHHD